MNMKRNKWRMILDIARTELQTLFYSPIAWLTLIIFVVQASMTFSSVFGTYVERFNLGYRPVNLTQGIFSGFSVNLSRLQYLEQEIRNMRICSVTLHGSMQERFQRIFSIPMIFLTDFMPDVMHSLCHPYSNHADSAS